MKSSPQTYLFVGGQYHGQMLPICDEALREATCQVETALRPSPQGRAYVGYYLSQIQLAAGGCRQLAIHRASAQTKERLIVHMTDAFSVALDHYERVLRSYRKGSRKPVPLNATLDDDAGHPGKRKPIRADGDGALSLLGPV